MEKNNKFLTINQLSLLLNVSRPTLRFWEKEFVGTLVPLRTKGGQRRYTSEHITIIEEIKKLKRTGNSLEEIKRKLGNETMAEAGNRRPGDLRADRIDLLAERVAEAVKLEVLSFFK